MPYSTPFMAVPMPVFFCSGLSFLSSPMLISFRTSPESTSGYPGLRSTLRYRGRRARMSAAPGTYRRSQVGAAHRLVLAARGSGCGLRLRRGTTAEAAEAVPDVQGHADAEDEQHEADDREHKSEEIRPRRRRRQGDPLPGLDERGGRDAHEELDAVVDLEQREAEQAEASPREDERLIAERRDRRDRHEDRWDERVARRRLHAREVDRDEPQRERGEELVRATEVQPQVDPRTGHREDPRDHEPGDGGHLTVAEPREARARAHLGG